MSEVHTSAVEASDGQVLAMMAYVAVHREREQAVAVADVLSRSPDWIGGRRFAVLSVDGGWALFDLSEDHHGDVESRAVVIVPEGKS